MRKLLFFLIIFSSGNQVSAQVFYQNFAKDYFVAMMDNGIKYKLIGDEAFDQSIIKALEEVWTLTKYQIVDSDAEINDDDVVLDLTKLTWQSSTDGPNEYDQSLETLLLIQKKYLGLKSLPRKKSLAYMYYYGFTPFVEKQNLSAYSMVMLGAIHNGLLRTYKDNLKGGGVGLYGRISKSILAQEKPDISSKTILIHEKLMDSIGYSVNYFEEKGLNIEVSSEEKYNAYLTSQSKEHVVLYYSKSFYSDILLYDLESNLSYFTRHYPLRVSKLPESLIKDWKERYF